ncbi:DUF2478 domain-containing protein [Bradyrhizobium oligotrophicum S58]
MSKHQIDVGIRMHDEMVEKVGVAAAPLVALVYDDGKYPYETFDHLVDHSRRARLKVAGALQRRVFLDENRRCDVLLEEIDSANRTPIFEDRGSGARGCRLDESALAEVTVRVLASLDARPNILMLNKFGKAECGGGGTLDLIARALDLAIPTIIGVPRSNIEAWRDFSGDMGIELEARGDVERWLESVREDRTIDSASQLR